MTQAAPGGRTPTRVRPECKLNVPMPWGRIISAIVLTVIIVGFVVLAVLNLVAGDAMIASSLWLLLVGTIGIAFCKEEGTRTFAVNLLGAFARRQFVERTEREHQAPTIRLGYRLLGFRFCYIEIEVGRIESVYWSPGQATHQAGRDMQDWSVGMWFDVDRIPGQRSCSVRPGQDIRIVGPQGPEQEIEALGLAFVAFLRAAGASLIAAEEDGRTVFKRRSAGAD